MDPFFSHRTGWNTLQDMIQTRTKRLAGAYEIHKFSRDAKDLLARIHVRPHPLHPPPTPTPSTPSPPPPTPTPILWIHDAVHILYMLSCNTLSMLTIACINVPCNPCINVPCNPCINVPCNPCINVLCNPCINVLCNVMCLVMLALPSGPGLAAGEGGIHSTGGAREEHCSCPDSAEEARDL